MGLNSSQHRSSGSILTGLVVACAMAATTFLVFVVAPTEATMGDIQRILYLHVAVAWCGLAGCVAMGLCGALYVVSRRIQWDFWSQAAGEVAWLCTTLTLATGSIWAHEAWGAWWTWEPRLTASLALWIVLAGIFLLRSGIDDPGRRGRICGVAAVVCTADVPLVLMATRWFRGVHPVAPEMEPRMRLVMVASVVCFTLLFGYLTVQRRRQLELVERAARLESLSWSS